MKKRKCKECKEFFTPHPSMFLPPTCEKMKCRQDYAMKHLSNKAKEKKKTNRKALKEFNQQDVKKQTITAKEVVQEYARLRDINEPCISCRKPTAKQWDGGHYMNAQYFSAVRLNTLNINKQCSHCNDWNNENKADYRKHLISKIGLEKVEWLEQQKSVKKYTAEYLNRFIKIFRKRVRILKKKNLKINSFS